MGSVPPPPDPAIYTRVAQSPLPEQYQLTDIIKSLPREVFTFNPLKAWGQILLTVLATGAGVYLLTLSPWYLVPLIWIYTGTAATGLFVVAHDCGHRSFARSDLLSDVVGHALLLPLVYPFHPWRIMHNLHHANTNKLHVDNAWHPFEGADWATAGPIYRLIMRTNRSYPWMFYWLGSLGHWLSLHFSPALYHPSQRNQVRLSIYLVYAFSLVFFPAMIYFTGFSGLAKYWLAPWLQFHFWLSTMTLVHHTVPHVPFLEETRWRDAAARLSYTIHCDYPPGVELLTHHINVHTPHHVSTAIPSYNLRAARASLLENWGQHINEAVFGWGLMKDILSQCQLYEPSTSLYTTFDAFDAATAAGKSPQSESASSNSPASARKSPAARKLLRSSGSPRRRATAK